LTVEVHVVTPEREVWSGDATMVIARGIDGEVGIQHGHAPLLIRMAIGPLRVHQESGQVRMAIDEGFMHVSSEGQETRVDVMADQATLETEIDVAAERARLEQAEAAVREGDEQAKREARRAEVRLSLAE